MVPIISKITVALFFAICYAIYMFIIKTQSSSKNATKYYTHRLVESKRDSMGKVYKQTILNLASNYSAVEEGLVNPY